MGQRKGLFCEVALTRRCDRNAQILKIFPEGGGGGGVEGMFKFPGFG